MTLIMGVCLFLGDGDENEGSRIKGIVNPFLSVEMKSPLR